MHWNIRTFPVLESNLYSLNPGFDILPAPRGVNEGANSAHETGRPIMKTHKLWIETLSILIISTIFHLNYLVGFYLFLFEGVGGSPLS